MDIVNLNKISIVSLPFSITDGTNTLDDAIVGDFEYINGLTQEEILNIQQQRFVNFLKIISDTQITIDNQNTING